MAGRKRRLRRFDNRQLVLLMVASMTAGAAIFNLMNTGAGQEKSISGKPWEDIEAVIATRVGDGYDEVGQCTGYVYWCLSEAYGVDWGTNSYVDGLESKLRKAEISKVAEGKTGNITSDMRPGDVVIFLDGRKCTHCAILGEKGRLYHAISSGVDNSMTLNEWMKLPVKQRNCDRYIIYRGVL